MQPVNQSNPATWLTGAYAFLRWLRPLNQDGCSAWNPRRVDISNTASSNGAVYRALSSASRNNGTDTLTLATGRSAASITAAPKQTMITYFQVNGVMYYVDPYGKHMGYEDVFTKIDMCRAHFDNVGLGADYVDRFVR